MLALELMHGPLGQMSFSTSLRGAKAITIFFCIKFDTLSELSLTYILVPENFIFILEYHLPFHIKRWGKS